MKKGDLDYAYIRAWGDMLGLSESTVEDDIYLARASKAPLTAFCKDYRGGFHLIDELIPGQLRRAVIRIAEEKYGAFYEGPEDEQG